MLFRAADSLQRSSAFREVVHLDFRLFFAVMGFPNHELLILASPLQPELGSVAQVRVFQPYLRGTPKNQPRRSGADVVFRLDYLPAPPVDVPAPPLGLTLEPARPFELLLGLLDPAPPGAADGCCIVLPVAPDCPEVEGAAPELVPPA